MAGFDSLVQFIEDPETLRLKAAIIALGEQLRGAVPHDAEEEALRAQRAQLLEGFRKRYYALGPEKTRSIKEFLSVVNRCQEKLPGPFSTICGHLGERLQTLCSG